MNVPHSLIRFSFCALLTCPTMVHAVGVTINDACGRSLPGNVASGSEAVKVSPEGNVTVTGFASGYAAGVGQCDTAAADGKPRCTLSASRTAVNKDESVTLYAKCTSSPATFTWNVPSGVPALPTNPTTTNSISVTFSKAGAYTYSVSGTTSTSIAGLVSTQVTILVSDPAATNEVPTCLLTFSPVSVLVGTTQDPKSTARVVCHPQAASFEWDPAETNAPAAPTGTGGVVTFAVPGTYTYKVRGKTASATPGPKASATVSVASDGTGCTPGPISWEGVAPEWSYSGDIISYAGMVGALRFTAATGYTDFYAYQHSAYTSYWVPNMTWSISKCKGDFNVPAKCVIGIFGQGHHIRGHTSLATYCPVVAGEQYYLNMRQDSCNPGPYGCGYRAVRAH